MLKQSVRAQLPVIAGSILNTHTTTSLRFDWSAMACRMQPACLLPAFAMALWHIGNQCTGSLRGNSVASARWPPNHADDRSRYCGNNTRTVINFDDLVCRGENHSSPVNSVVKG
ncbi:hypothetical protein KCP76_03340 [Salmonella enterica subsp. enterica serovar Weltevreden]|nr:hypothetical protein KCP76_03340 [Salmonella enterica subsp. enterica serovar Weltevreden]